MYAVIETGGKQYRVTPGDSLRVESIIGENGSAIEFDAKMVVNDGEISPGGKVQATIEGHGRGAKVIVFKFKRKKQYKKTIGHRQNFTQVKIEGIA